eukprot:2231061-Amphidinium_carterae.1
MERARSTSASNKSMSMQAQNFVAQLCDWEAGTTKSQSLSVLSKMSKRPILGLNENCGLPFSPGSRLEQ